MQTKQNAKTRFDMTNRKRIEHKKKKVSLKFQITNQFGEKCPLPLMQYKKFNWITLRLKLQFIITENMLKLS